MWGSGDSVFMCTPRPFATCRAAAAAAAIVSPLPLLRPHARALFQILDPVKELGWLEPPTTSQSRKLLDTRLCTWYMRSPKR